MPRLKGILDMCWNLGVKRELALLNAEWAVLQVFNIVFREKPINVLIVVDIVNHGGSRAMIGPGAEMLFHLSWAKQQVCPRRNRGMCVRPFSAFEVPHDG